MAFQRDLPAFLKARATCNWKSGAALEGGRPLVAIPRGKEVGGCLAVGGESQLTPSFRCCPERFRPSPLFCPRRSGQLFLDGVNVERLAALIASQAGEASSGGPAPKADESRRNPHDRPSTRPGGAHTQVVGPASSPLSRGPQ